jgi:hypothetical protein
MSLPIEWVEKIFSRLQGVYGNSFTAKYSTGIHDGVDSGIENAKRTWCDELAGFKTWPEAIGYALKHLPEKAPNAIEFREVCRRAPKEQKPALEYKPTEEELTRQKEMARKAACAVAGEKDHLLWIRRPRSKGAFAIASDCARSGDLRAKRILAELKEAGICTDTQLLKKWDGAQWIKA